MCVCVWLLVKYKPDVPYCPETYTQTDLSVECVCGEDTSIICTALQGHDKAGANER